MAGIREGRFLPMPDNAAEIAASPIVGDARRFGECVLYQGDCAKIIRAMDANALHAVVTDPPYGIGFMGQSWDEQCSISFNPETWRLALNLLRPGGHLAAFGGARTYHRLGVAIESAGFAVREQIMFLFGNGFPKSHDISKCIDKRGGMARSLDTRPHALAVPSHHPAVWFDFRPLHGLRVHGRRGCAGGVPLRRRGERARLFRHRLRADRGGGGAAARSTRVVLCTGFAALGRWRP